jgi:streptogramin lyase
MPDVQERFRSLSSAGAPELWPDIMRREPGSFPSETGRRGPGRILVTAAALVVGVAGVVLVVRAFTAPGRAPAPPASSEGTSGPITARIVDRIPLEEQVGGVLTAFGNVWIHAFGRDESPVLLGVDPSTDHVEARIHIDAPPPWEVGGGAMAAGEGSVWVTGARELPGSHGDLSDAIVDRMDPATGQVVAALQLGGQFGADIAVGDSGVWVAVFGDREAEAVHIDPDTNRVLATIPLSHDYVRRIVVVDGAVVVEERGWNKEAGPHTVLEAIDPETNQIMATAGDDPEGGLEEVIAVDGNVWASTHEGFVLLNPRTLEPSATSVPGAIPDGPLPVLTAGSGAVWFVGLQGRLYRFDPGTETVDSLIDVPGRPIALAVDADSVWSLDYDGTLVRIDVSGGA